MLHVWDLSICHAHSWRGGVTERPHSEEEVSALMRVTVGNVLDVVDLDLSLEVRWVADTGAVHLA